MNQSETRAEARLAISDWAGEVVFGNKRIKNLMDGQCTPAKCQSLAAHLNNWNKFSPCSSVITSDQIDCEHTVAAVGNIVWNSKSACLRGLQ